MTGWNGFSPRESAIFDDDMSCSNGRIGPLTSIYRNGQQAAKAKVRGYQSTKYLMAMVYPISGKLDFKLPTLNSEEPKGLFAV